MKLFFSQVFTTFFLFEAILKLAALSKEYFANGWNIFDLVIVVGSLLDLGLEGVDGISVMRGMRLVSGVTTRRIRRREKLKGSGTFMYMSNRFSFTC